MLSIKFTTEEARNALAFLARVDLKGSEAQAFLAIAVKFDAMLRQPAVDASQALDEAVAQHTER